VFIKLTRGAAPKLLVVRGPGTEPATYYGPFVGARRVNDAVRELSDALLLRDCSLDRDMSFADQHELFQLAPRTPGCIRLEVRKCLGPCVAACSAAQYQAQVNLARAFLEGTTDDPIARLKAEMELCATSLQFERAAALRDKVQRLEELREMFSRLRFAVETLSFTYVVPGYQGDDRVYLIRRGTVRAEAFAPRGAHDRARLLDMVRTVFDPPERSGGAIPTHEIDELLLLSSWFRRNPAELERTQAPSLVLADSPATRAARSA
jgi:excinuclease ABC subunit C